MIYYSIIFFIYGLCIGSFLNVVIYRVPKEENVAKGRSYCPKCNKQLTALELIPVFSWLFQGGRCKGCKAKISIQYPLIELIVGVLFLIAYLKYGLTITTFIMIIFWSMLLVMAIIDYKTHYVYDSLIIVTIVPIVILSFFDNYDFKSQLISAGVCFLVYLLVHLITKKYYGEEVFGFGDVLLIVIIGYVVDLKFIFLTIFMPYYVAIIFVAISYFKNKNKSNKMETEKGEKMFIPLLPSIAISAFMLTYFDTQMDMLLTWFFSLY